MEDEWESPSFWYKTIDAFGNNHLFSFIYTKYIRTLELSGNENILDFGSGSGAGSKHLAKLIQGKTGHLSCLDTSSYWTSVAKKLLRPYNHVTFYNDSITNLHLPEHSFDIIYIHYTLHDVPKVQRTGIIAEFYRIMKPTGRLCIKEPQRTNDGMPVEEIEELMSANGLIKMYSLTKKGTFSGIYHK